MRSSHCVSLTALVLSSLIGSSASAAITVYNDQGLYQVATTSLSQGLENFNAYSGNYSSPLVGVADGVTWTATSNSGFTINNGQMSTAMPGSMNIAFSGVDVYGVYGNFFGTDANGNLAPGLVIVQLANGSGLTLYVDNPNEFFGFVSNDAPILSISATAQSFPNPNPVLRASVDNLGFSFVIPAPGAVALLGLAGLVSRRRR
jgi:hypothetical protein